MKLDFNNQFDVRYRGCVVYLFNPLTGERRLARLLCTLDKRALIHARMYNENTQEWEQEETIDLQEWQIEHQDAVDTYIDIKEIAMYISYRHTKQWKKRVHEDRLQLEVPTFLQQNVLWNYVAQNDDYVVNLLKKYDNPVFEGVSTALSMIKSGEKLGVSIDRHFALYATPLIRNIVLYYKNNPVGIADGEDIILSKKADYLYEQLSTVTECKIQ